MAGSRAAAKPLGHWPARNIWMKGNASMEEAISGVRTQTSGRAGNKARASSASEAGQTRQPMTRQDKLPAVTTSPGTKDTMACQPAG